MNDSRTCFNTKHSNHHKLCMYVKVPTLSELVITNPFITYIVTNK